MNTLLVKRVNQYIMLFIKNVRHFSQKYSKETLGLQHFQEYNFISSGKRGGPLLEQRGPE